MKIIKYIREESPFENIHTHIEIKSSSQENPGEAKIISLESNLDRARTASFVCLIELEYEIS